MKGAGYAIPEKAKPAVLGNGGLEVPGEPRYVKK
jgi:hypothetical protein